MENKNDNPKGSGQVDSVSGGQPLEPPTALALNKAISTCTQAVESLPREAQQRVFKAAEALLGLDGPAPQSRGASSQQRPTNGNQQQQRGRS